MINTYTIPLRIRGDGALIQTFLSCWCIFVRRFLVLLLTPQVACVNSHGGFDLLLGQFHAIIKDPEEFF